MSFRGFSSPSHPRSHRVRNLCKTGDGIAGDVLPGDAIAGFTLASLDRMSKIPAMEAEIHSDQNQILLAKAQLSASKLLDQLIQDRASLDEGSAIHRADVTAGQRALEHAIAAAERLTRVLPAAPTLAEGR
jgi:replicative superfamily II helicase